MTAFIIIIPPSAFPITNSHSTLHPYLSAFRIPTSEFKTVSHAVFYANWATLTGSLGAKLAPFFDGAGEFFTVFGISARFGAALIAVVVVGFAMTTLDSGTRLLRYNIEEFADTVGLKKFVHRYISSFLAVAALAAVALWKVPAGTAADGSTIFRPAGIILWQLFGATNQLMACLALLVVTVFLIKFKRPSWYTGIPFAFMLVITCWAMSINILKGWSSGEPEKRSWSIVIVGALLVIVALWLAVEALFTVAKARRARGEGCEEPAGDGSSR